MFAWNLLWKLLKQLLPIASSSSSSFSSKESKAVIIHGVWFVLHGRLELTVSPRIDGPELGKSTENCQTDDEGCTEEE